MGRLHWRRRPRGPSEPTTQTQHLAFFARGQFVPGGRGGLMPCANLRKDAGPCQGASVASLATIFDSPDLAMQHSHPAFVKPLEDLSQARRLGADLDDLAAQTLIPKLQVGVLPRHAFGRSRGAHRAGGTRRALGAPSAHAATNRGIDYLEWAPHRRGSTASLAAHARRRDLKIVAPAKNSYGRQGPISEILRGRLRRRHSRAAAAASRKRRCRHMGRRFAGPRRQPYGMSRAASAP